MRSWEQALDYGAKVTGCTVHFVDAGMDTGPIIVQRAVPILDGGQIVYHGIEGIKGSPLSERAQLIGQQVGIFALLLLMSFAFYNDIARILG